MNRKPKNKRKKLISVRLDPLLLKELDRLAKERKETRTAMLELLIDAYFAELTWLRRTS